MAGNQKGAVAVGLLGLLLVACNAVFGFQEASLESSLVGPNPSSTSTTTPQTACQAKATRACFDGDQALAGVGACVKGKQACSDDGAGFGACTGQGTPSAQACGTPATDNDCDGTPGCTGSLNWKIDLQAPRPSLVRSGGSSGVYVAGRYSTSFTDFGMTFPQGQQGDVYVAKLDSAGKPIWGFPINGVGPDDVLDMIVDDGGNATVLGTFGTGEQGDLKIGSTILHTQNIGTPQFFVVKFGPNGKVIWVDQIDGGDFSQLPGKNHKLAFGAGGAVFVMAVTSNEGLTVKWGPTLAQSAFVSSVGPELDRIHFIELSSGGSFLGSATLRCTPDTGAPVFTGASLQALATTPGAVGSITNVYAGVTCDGPVWDNVSYTRDAGPGGPMLVKLIEKGDGTFFVDASAGVPGINALAADTMGNVYIATAAKVGGKTTFSVEKRSPLALLGWVTTARSPDSDSLAKSIALDVLGNVVLGGDCAGFLALDPNSGAGDTIAKGSCLAKYSPTGEFIWAHTEDGSAGFGDLGIAAFGGIYVAYKTSLASLKP